MIPSYDLCIIGGGINGAGIARDAAGRGYRVLLVEKGDLAGATSSASTKLIHGGLRYLEYFEFGLVRDSLKEREVLLSIAPHLVHPTTFILPHDAHQRPAWMIGLGLLLYDNLYRRKKLAASKRIDFQRSDFGKPLGNFKKGFCYTDCRTDDSRLVAVNIVDAAGHGAEILTRTECVKLIPENGQWRITLKDEQGAHDIKAAMVVNATGPWVRKFIDASGLATPDVPGIRLVKGSHIIIRRKFEGTRAYMLQQPDKRIVFVIPYEDDFMMIGTTEENFKGDPGDVRISDEEIEYLCGAFNDAFKTRATLDDIEWTFSGVRPLLDDGKDEARKVTRDYHLHLHEELPAPMISVFGGKLTTFRVLSEKVVNMLDQLRGKPEQSWTGDAPLPGGDMPFADFELFLKKKAVEYDWLPEKLLQRYARTYGTRMDRFLEGARSLKDLGRDFGADLYEAEVFYLVKNEWARTSEDILWRRTKQGLYAEEDTLKALETALPGVIGKVMAA